MTVGEAQMFAWQLARPMVEMLLFVAVLLLGFSLLREITR